MSELNCGPELSFGSLFAGIGGMDLGLERAGWECRWQVENNEWCQRILAKHWPNVPRYGDVRAVGDELERVDLICGGFPCQPVSKAGRRKAQADDRWLWPEFARLIRLLRPRFVLLENVPGLLNANSGSAFGDVLGDLATLRYDVEWDCIPAISVGAPHLRDRFFGVAYAHDSGCFHGQAQVFSAEGRLDALRQSQPSGADVADTDSKGLTDVQGSAAVSQRTRIGAIGHSGWWDVEPPVGRVADGVPRRVDRIRGLGNAVVPQVAEYIGRRLMAVAS